MSNFIDTQKLSTDEERNKDGLHKVKFRESDQRFIFTLDYKNEQFSE